MSPRLYLMVGIPGCGKSTFVEDLRHKTGAAVLSSDEIREELTGDLTDQSANRTVFYIIDKMAKKLLDYGHNVIIDATNLNAVYRQKFLKFATETGATPVAYRFGVSETLDFCQRRNINRTANRIVPEEVMRRFHNIFMEECSTEQLENEGWIVVNVG